jgi:phosphonate transport system ATP-binding protein
MQPAIRVTTLSKTFGERRALDAVNLEVLPGEMVALIGASGSGKSTLLRAISGLVCSDPGSGQVLVHGAPAQRDGRLVPEIRRVRAGIGFIFQQFNLVGRLPLIVNVLTGALPRMPLWRSLARRFSRAELRLGMEALARVGIADQAAQRASTLRGQQQRRLRGRSCRVRSRARDEPIASLDPESSRRVMEILAAINREDRCTVLVSLHQVNVALKYCPRTVALRQGKVVYDGPSADLSPALLRELYGAEADEILSTSDHISALGPRRLETVPVQAARAA